MGNRPFKAQTPRRNPKDKLRSSFLVRIFDDGEVKLLDIRNKEKYEEELKKDSTDPAPDADPPVKGEPRSWIDVARAMKLTTKRNKGKHHQKIEYVLRWRPNGRHHPLREVDVKHIRNTNVDKKGRPGYKRKPGPIPIEVIRELELKSIQQEHLAGIRGLGPFVAVQREKFKKRIVFNNTADNNSRRVEIVAVASGIKTFRPQKSHDEMGKHGELVEKILKWTARKRKRGGAMESKMRTRYHPRNRQKDQAWPRQADKITTPPEEDAE